MYAYVNTTYNIICICTESLLTQSYCCVHGVYISGTGVIAWLYWYLDAHQVAYTDLLHVPNVKKCLKYGTSGISLFMTEG